MDSRSVDVAIIGTGTAGMGAYRAATAHTRSVALVEGGAYGTTCARVGCMPSKLLIAAADAAHHVRSAGRFGIQAGAPRIDEAAVMTRVRAERDRFVGFVTDAVDAWPAEQRITGHARFVGPGELEVDGRLRLRARSVVIATGSHAVVPEGWRKALGPLLLTSEDVFALERLPRSLAVVGAGVIGLELGLALQRLGVTVRVFDRGGRFAGLTDPEVARAAREILGRELPIARIDEITGVARVGAQAQVAWRDAAGAQAAMFDGVLVAAGRRPNLDGLDLEAAGLARDAMGRLAVDSRTTQVAGHPVFVAGDAAGRHLVLHEAADEGRIAGDNAARFPDVRLRRRRAGLAIAFTDPQVAIAGRSHAELLASGEPFEAVGFDFADQGRSRVMARNQGFLRAYGSPGNGRFLGAEMIAPDAEHLGHLLAWSVHANLDVQQMLDAPYYHPVVEEGLRTALRQLRSALRLGPPPIGRCLDCGPGA